MAKPKQVVPETSRPSVSGTFVGVGKESHLLYSAFEIKVEDGEVVDVKVISRAPDLQASAIGRCSSELWRAGRVQSAANIRGDK